jgi:putative transposase
VRLVKKKFKEGRTLSELRSFISDKEALSVRSQCELIGISRSGVYYQPAGECDENLKIMLYMDKHFQDHPSYGVLQMQDFILTKGIVANKKRIRRLLRKMNIMAIFPGRNLSKLINAEYKRPYLIRGLKIERANQLWEIDITYVAMRKGFMYLTAIIDVFSRFVVGWDVFNSLDAKNSLSVLKKAVAKHGNPEIINSDQGCQFTSELWTSYIENELTGTRISMDGRGRATDNIYIERLWRTVKRDYVYIYPADDGIELYKGLKKFFDRYNHKKGHQGIGRVIPFKRYKNVA